MAEEVELKLALATGDQSKFLRHPLLKKAIERRVETLDNIYYDTADLSLRRHGISLRLRRRGRDWLQTVKLAGTSAAGLSSRPEWEIPYAGHFDFSVIDVELVRERLQNPKLLARIIPICETRFRRISWRFSATPGAVLLTLDRGWVIASGQREAISEVELELAGASVHAIFGLATQLAQRVALTPSVLSKAERGYRLHVGATPEPFRAKPAILWPAMPPWKAFRHIALSCLEHLQQNHPGAQGSDDPEYIHQMRVATRRLRAAIRLFAPILPSATTKPLHASLSALMKQLGLARDLDVLLNEIVAPVLSALPDEPGLSALSSDITNRRYAVRTQTITMLATPIYGLTLLAALESLHASPPAALNTSTLHDFASEQLRRLRRKVRRLALAARIDDPAALHALRISIKRLRYALEFFAPLMAKQASRRILKQLTVAQDTLGKLNDLTNAGTLLVSCAGDDPRLREAVTLIGGWHGSHYTNLLDTISRDLPGLIRLRIPGFANDRK